MKAIPEVGKTYDCFDDGKLSKSRHYQVEIEELIPFNEAKGDVQDWQRSEANQCHWLYAKESDYIVKAKPVGEGGDLAFSENKEEHYFVRTKDGGWFSLGFWAGRLDIDGTLMEAMQQRYEV